MTITAKQKRDLNRMNASSKSVLLGNIIDELQDLAYTSASSLVISASSISGFGDLAYTSASSLAISASSISGLGSISTQSASAVSITGGSIVAENASFGSGENRTYFESDGTMMFSGSATVWDDIFFPLVTAKQGQTDKPLFDTNEVGYLFPQNDTSEFMYMVAQFPHSMKVGSNIDPHVHWKQTASGSPIFKMDYKWMSIGQDVPSSWSTHVMSTPAITYTSGSVHQLTYGSMISGSMISGSSIGVSSLMLIKLYRDTGDSYTGNAVVYQFDIHFEKNSLGSRLEYAK